MSTRARRPTPTLADPIAWRFDAQLSCLFEIDVAQVARLLPPGRNPLEIRPGVGLLLVAAHRAPAGNLGHLDALYEFDWTIAVESDVWPGVPAAHFAFAQGRIFSENRAFVEHAHGVDRMQAEHVPSLRIDFDETGFHVDVSDDRGAICSMTSLHASPPVWNRRTYWGQQTTRLPNGTWSQAWALTAEVFQHQQCYGKPAAVLHPHPVWAGLDVRGLGERTYEQLVARLGAPIEMVFYRPELVVPPPGERGAPSSETGVGGA